MAPIRGDAYRELFPPPFPRSPMQNFVRIQHLANKNGRRRREGKAGVFAVIIVFSLAHFVLNSRSRSLRSSTQKKMKIFIDFLSVRTPHHLRLSWCLSRAACDSLCCARHNGLPHACMRRCVRRLRNRGRAPCSHGAEVRDHGDSQLRTPHVQSNLRAPHRGIRWK